MTDGRSDAAVGRPRRARGKLTGRSPPAHARGHETAWPGRGDWTAAASHAWPPAAVCDGWGPRCSAGVVGVAGVGSEVASGALAGRRLRRLARVSSHARQPRPGAAGSSRHPLNLCSPAPSPGARTGGAPGGGRLVSAVAPQDAGGLRRWGAATASLLWYHRTADRYMACTSCVVCMSRR
jgi:hypothetical protein